MKKASRITCLYYIYTVHIIQLIEELECINPCTAIYLKQMHATIYMCVYHLSLSQYLIGSPVLGWSPAPFVSSRSQKAAQVQQRPEDYMDEDVGVAICSQFFL